MNIGILLPLILIAGVMLMMTRSAKNKQRQAAEMRSRMEPGTGVRTIGGMYAVVKEVNDETVLLELTEGVHAHFAKNAIGAVLGEDEFNRIVHGIDPEDSEDPEGPEGTDDSDDAEDSASAENAGDGADEAAGSADASGDGPVDLGKSDQAEERNSSAAGAGSAKGSGAK